MGSPITGENRKVCVCVCVCEREREREREKWAEIGRESERQISIERDHRDTRPGVLNAVPGQITTDPVTYIRQQQPSRTPPSSAVAAAATLAPPACKLWTLRAWPSTTRGASALSPA